MSIMVKNMQFIEKKNIRRKNQNNYSFPLNKNSNTALKQKRNYKARLTNNILSIPEASETAPKP